VSDDGQLDGNSRHGTVVSAIVAATAPQTNLLVFDADVSGDGFTIDSVLAAINRVIEIKTTTQRRIVALNMSFYQPGLRWTENCDVGDPFAVALQLVYEAYIQPVACAGNDGFSDGISSPACVTHVAGVGAVYDANVGTQEYKGVCTDQTTAADQVGCFSDSGEIMRVWAPGALITAAGRTGWGTSFASPHVAGAVAVLRGLSAYPTDPLWKTILRMTATGTNITDPRNSVTKPRLNVEAAITQTSGW